MESQHQNPEYRNNPENFHPQNRSILHKQCSFKVILMSYYIKTESNILAPVKLVAQKSKMLNKPHIFISFSFPDII